MRFDLSTLAAVLTASAIHLGLYRAHPVWSLSLATLIMVMFFIVCRIQRGNARGGKLIVVGAAAGFGWMMTFGGLTFATHYFYRQLTNAWPDSAEVHVDTPTAMIIFTLIYGGLSLIAGLLIGSLATIFVRLHSSHPSPRAMDNK